MTRWAALISLLLSLAAPAHLLGQLLPDDELRTVCAERIDTLILQLKDQEPWSRWVAVQCLGKLKDPRATEPLVRALYAERYPRGSALIESILKDIGDPNATSLLLQGLKNEHTRTSSIYALARIGSPQAIEPLITILKRGDEEDRRSAASALGGMKDPRVVAAMLVAFRDKDEILRRYVASSLGELEDTSAVAPLIEALDDSDEGVRWNSVNSLGKLRAEAAVQPLLDICDDVEEREEIRKDAISAIGEIGDVSAIDPLIERFRSSTGALRLRLSAALAKFDGPMVEEVLMNSLRQGEYQVIAAAHSFYIRKGDRAYVPALITAIRQHGDYDIARDYIDSGNSDLADAGRQWIESQHSDAVTY